MTRRLAGLALAAAVASGACGAAGASGAPAAASSAPPASAAVATPPIAVPSLSPAATLPLPSGASVALDASLLSILPSTVAGVPVTQEAQSFGEAVNDPAFVASVDRAVFFVAVTGGDLASGVVAHLRPGVYSDAMYADWRASYDDGACAQASGVVAHAEQTLGGRTTDVTTCGGGLRVYHTYLPAKGVIVSLISTGAADLGGQLAAGIAG